jgi:hypothetical protein
MSTFTANLINRDLINNAEPFASDPRNKIMSEAELREFVEVKKAGFDNVADYHAHIKARFAAERRQQEADAETARLFDEINSLKAWHSLRNAFIDKRDRLKAGIARLHRHGESVEKTQHAIADAAKRAVQALLIKTGLRDPQPDAEPENVADPAALEAALIAETRARKVADDALAIANQELDLVEKQIKATNERRNKYMRPELDHLSTRLTGEYVKAIAQVRKAYSRLAACGFAIDGETLGYHGNQWPKAPAIAFPRFPTVPKGIPDDKLLVEVSDTDIRFWEGIVKILENNPDADIQDVKGEL